MSDPIFACGDCLRLTPSMSPCPHCGSVRTVRYDVMPANVQAVFTTGQSLIDYRDLLRKYMRHVSSAEGATFTGYGHRDDSHGDVTFTDAEWDELRIIADSLKD